MWQENARSLGNGRREICGGRNDDMGVALEGREPNLGAGLRCSGWSSRVLTLKPKRAFCGHLQGSARASDDNQVEGDPWGQTATCLLKN